MKEPSKFHCFCNNVTIYCWMCVLTTLSSGDEDGCQGRQSTETLVSLIKSRRWSSFKFDYAKSWVGEGGFVLFLNYLFKRQRGTDGVYQFRKWRLTRPLAQCERTAKENACCCKKPFKKNAPEYQVMDRIFKVCTVQVCALMSERPAAVAKQLRK